MNIEHRTFNIERRILMTLRFIYFKSSEPQNVEGQLLCFPQPFFIRQNTLFDVGRSMFDVRRSFFQLSPQKKQLSAYGINPRLRPSV
jgi:hypothetical protein